MESWVKEITCFPFFLFPREIVDSIILSLMRVLVNHLADRFTAYRAELLPVPGEHDAVGIGPVDAVLHVTPAFKSAYFPGVFHVVEEGF